MSSLPRATRQMRVVELPINASEDRVVGSIDIEAAIKKGEKEFEPGVLAEANRNILYVDEVNLLDDHIVDVLLDAAAMGTNTVEREGVWSRTRPLHPGRDHEPRGGGAPSSAARPLWSLRGRRGNPRRASARRDRGAPGGFRGGSRGVHPVLVADEYAEAERIRRAILSLADVAVGRDILVAIAHLGIELEVDGHRSDLVNRKAAQAVAAHEGRDRVTLEDVEHVAPMVLAHRVKPQVAAGRRGLEIGEILRSAGSGSSGRQK